MKPKGKYKPRGITKNPVAAPVPCTESGCPVILMRVHHKRSAVCPVHYIERKLASARVRRRRWLLYAFRYRQLRGAMGFTDEAFPMVLAKLSAAGIKLRGG